MLNADDELEALKELFKELKRLEKNPLSLRTPPDLSKFGIFLMRINLEAYKTHSRAVSFLPNNKGAETSDVVVLVTHEFLDPAVTLVDEKISFFQAKIETRKDGFKITPRQWHLMRHWPEFRYKGETFELISCRRVPDVCSFYLFLFRDKSFTDTLFGTRWSVIEMPYFIRRSKCTINSVCMSTPWMERLKPSLRNLKEKDLLLDKPVDLSFNETEQVDKFFRLLWFLFSTHLGVHDPRGVDLMKTMFPEAFNKHDPRSYGEDEEKPSIGVKITIQLRTEREYTR